MSETHLRQVYEAYSNQDLHRLLAFVATDVDWPDGEQRIHGRAQVAAYWTEQWSRVLTVDVPTVIALLSETVRVVGIDQVVRSLDGQTVSHGRFAHVLHLDGPLISRLDIVPLKTR